MEKMYPGKLCRKLLNCWLYLTLVSGVSYAQQPFSQHKLSPTLEQKIRKINTDDSIEVRVMVSSRGLPPSLAGNYRARETAGNNKGYFYVIKTTAGELAAQILPDRGILFVEDAARVAKDEGLINNFDLGANKINMVHARHPQLNGEGLSFSLKENNPDTTDIDLAGRYIATSTGSAITSPHANNMATMIAGAGNTWYSGKGVAWKALISSSSYANLFPDAAVALAANNISVQNHSYGVGIENYYGPEAAAYDSAIVADTVIVHVFSSGNSGELASGTGAYSALPGYANLTGDFKMAKNIITVGATDSFGNLALQSSRGPAFDGRIKPELTAFGIDGSSGAAALVSGVSLLLQQQYQSLLGSLPASALVKAVLINSAEDRGNTGPDFSNGYGSLDAINAVRTLAEQRYFTSKLTDGESRSFPLDVPAGIKHLKITLVWNDPPAAINPQRSLVNDLDLQLLEPGSDTPLLPWVLNSSPRAEALNAPATRLRDTLNNVEQITVGDPPAGNYRLIVKGSRVSTAEQPFYLAYQLDAAGVFEWESPQTVDPVQAGSTNTLRWRFTGSSRTGALAMSTDRGSSWQLADDAVDLGKGYYYWATPVYNGPVLLRMAVGAALATTDTIRLSSKPDPRVGFNCPDSFQLYWSPIAGADTYRTYGLAGRYMEPVIVTADTSVIIRKQEHGSLYYSVAPVFAGREAVRSYTINYELQGVGCYIRSFLATMAGGAAQLDLSLGTLYNVRRIVLEKFDGQNFREVQAISGNLSLEASFTDNNLQKGVNRYRARLTLASGNDIYSSAENIIYFGSAGYIVYPNPARVSQQVSIAQKELDGSVMQVFDIRGARLLEKELDDRINTIPAGLLGKGVYFARITNNKQFRTIIRFVVY
jgi:hypothetical protein